MSKIGVDWQAVGALEPLNVVADPPVTDLPFNAAYAVDRKVELALSPGDATEAQRRSSHFEKLVPLDGNRRIYNVLATESRARAGFDAERVCVLGFLGLSDRAAVRLARLAKQGTV